MSRSSAELYTLVFFREQNVMDEAMVIAVKVNGLRVLVPKYGIEGSIRLVSKEEEEKKTSKFKYDATNMSLTSDDVKYKIFDVLKVRIYVKAGKNRREWLVVELADEEGESAPNKNNVVKGSNSNSGGSTNTSGVTIEEMDVDQDGEGEGEDDGDDRMETVEASKTNARTRKKKTRSSSSASSPNSSRQKKQRTKK